MHTNSPGQSLPTCASRIQEIQNDSDASFLAGCVKTLDGRCEEQVKIDALQWFPPSVGRTRRHVEAKRSADSSESIINSAAPSFHVCLRRTCDAQCLPRHCRGLGTSIQHETSANCCSMPTRADLCMQLQIEIARASFSKKL